MSLAEKDLKSIAGLIHEEIESNNANIQDIIDFAIEKSEIKMESNMEAMMDGKIGKLANDLSDFRDEMHREISDIAETNRAFLAKMDNHENRIEKLEIKTGLAT